MATAARAGLRPRWLWHRKVGKRSEWDFEQLAYIAEIAERLGKGEDVVLVVADFWGRGIKDHRGLPWGQVQHKEGKGTGNGFEWYWRATRWFHRMKHSGKLPPPYCDTAHTIPEPPRFTVEKRHKRPNAKPVIDEKPPGPSSSGASGSPWNIPRPEPQGAIQKTYWE